MRFFTCNCLHSGAQNKFLSSFLPARPSLPASHSAHTGPINAKKIHKAISINAYIHTSIGATQEIPELHVGSQYAETRSTAKSWMSVHSSPLSLHFLVVLYAVTYRRVKTPAHWMFRTDTPGGLSFISKLLPPPSKCLILILSPANSPIISHHSACRICETHHH